MKRAFVNWSGGKDCSLALYKTLQDPSFKVEMLLSTVDESSQKVSMHEVPALLLAAQSEAMSIPLYKVRLPTETSTEQYNKIMRNAMKDMKGKGLTHSIFGDIFLEDLREYREKRLLEVGITPVFPIWKRDTTELFHECIALRFKAVVVSINERYLDPSFLGRPLNESFLRDLPPNVDPCGENGEFHSFVYDAPFFQQPVPITFGERRLKTYKSPVPDEEETRIHVQELMVFS